MRRLQDEASSADPMIARAAKLIASMPPFELPTILPPVARPDTAIPHFGWGHFRTAVVVPITLVSLAAAAATLHRAGFFAHPAAPPAAHVEVVASEAIDSPPKTVEPKAPMPISGVDRTEAVEPRAPAVSAPSRPVESARSGSQAESMLMVEAVRALRRDRDPGRTQALAEEVLRRFPRGQQVEEAMALILEAAVASGDEAEARRAARAYLERYPHGRFADRARAASGAP